MEHQEGSFSGYGGIELFYQSWFPNKKPLALLAIVHGFSDHSGRYDHLVTGMLRRDFAVLALDLRGHGRSPGARGHINSFSEYRQDVHAFTRLISQKAPDAPLFLFGHSMGGLIVLDYGLHYPENLAGVIASAPHLADPPISPALAKIGQIMSRVWPGLTLNVGLDDKGLSRDPAVVEAYRSDPLVHGKGTPRLSAELATAVVETQANAAKFQPPLLIFHGDADTLTSPEASRRFFDNVQIENKAYLSYYGGYHEAHNDIHRERVIAEIGQWLIYQIQLATEHTENTE